MDHTINRKLYIYSSLFIAFALNLPKLFALKKDGLIAQYWHFNLAELLLQTLLNLLFCFLIFYYSENKFDSLFFKKWEIKKQGIYIVINAFTLIVAAAAGVFFQRFFFPPNLLYGGGITLRLIFSLLLIFIELRIVYLLQETKNKEIENEHLRNAYLKSELEVLKSQINPHFFFNSLSSLSGVVRENPELAVHYINHLSKVFRYSLIKNDNNLVSLKEELNAAKSYAELMKMRYEQGFQINIDIDEKDYNLILPHMSLQPLIENALKHNIASASRPLCVKINLQDNFLCIENNLQSGSFVEAGTNIGLANLNDRYRILMRQEIEILQTKNSFIVKLPLK